ncbi:HlyD family secretion protein [Vibrio clamense]|uniref:efflux RND transporter periplasmic adaptor subunit n=1 Tax=Vibrio TaxID=662 RepID=UPI0010BDF8C9|nr:MULTISPECIES: HlyD family secretion protein [Vibrio]MDN3699440.1 HlyD family secretion protein [Vibrio cortegadensis]NOH83590.1 HlyD family secretion protein [Vibrio sp. 03-59-1]TKF23090.1 HlyD family secretion protein [Vibrio genomosp. F6]
MKVNRKFLFFPALAVGVVVLVLAINLRPDLPTNPATDRARLVDTMPLELKSMAPVAIGYGKVTPKFEWKAIAEVTGKVVYRHPNLEKGQVLPKDTEIIRIDPLDYELKLTQAQADLKSSQTQLAKLSLEERNLQQTLGIEQNRLSLSKQELGRIENLRKKGLSSQSDVDQQTQSYLSQQKLVQDMKNQLQLFPDEQKVAQAVVRVNQSKVQEAQRSLDKTSIRLPRSLRIASVDIEINQVVNLQQTMVVGHGMDVMEVEAQLSIHDMHTLASSVGSFTRDDAGIPKPDMAFINAEIELNSGNLKAIWPAKVARISETVDVNQATAGVILEATQNYADLTPESLPPLVNGMFVQATIEGQQQPSWVIPERALHGNRIYLMSPESRLEIRTIEVLYRRDNQVVINGDIEQGERLVLNDLLPAIDGMMLREATVNSVNSTGANQVGDES